MRSTFRKNFLLINVKMNNFKYWKVFSKYGFIVNFEIYLKENVWNDAIIIGNAWETKWGELSNCLLFLKIILWFYCSSNTNCFYSWRKITVENIGFLRYFRSIFHISYLLILELALFLKKSVDWFVPWRFILQRLRFFL